MQSLQGLVQTGLSSIPMAVVANTKSLAFAAYREETEEILIEEFRLSDDETHEIAGNVVRAIQPTLLLLSSKTAADECLLEALTTRSPADTINDDDSDDEDDEERGEDDTQGGGVIQATEERSSIPYRILKTSSFELRSCKSRILGLHVGSLQHSEPQQHAISGARTMRVFPQANQGTNPGVQLSRYHALASVINFDSTSLVQALGSLLSFLLTTNFRFSEAGAVFVADIVPADVRMYMTISHESLSALQIFSTEHHPLMASKGTGNSKEGLSLFSLLDRTGSSAGRRMLRQWMLNPLIDVDSIKFRQDGVELFMLREMQDDVANIRKFFKNIGSVDKVLVRLLRSTLRPSDFLLLSRALSSAVDIVDTLQDAILWKLKQRAGVELDGVAGQLAEFNYDPNAEYHLAFLEELVHRCDVSTMQTIIQRVNDIVDEEATAAMKGVRVEIKAGYYEELDTLKHTERGLDGKQRKVIMLQTHLLEDILYHLSHDIKESYPHLAQVLSALYLPEIGFVVGISNEIDWKSDGVLPEDYEFSFFESSWSYFKTDAAHSLDEKIGDLAGRIKDIERSILVDLEEDILDCDAQLRSSFEALAELDCILSFATCAIEFGYVRPEILPPEECCVEVQMGRHPLQEIISPGNFIPNDIRIDSTRRVNVITGPNFSGKSCYARQVGILAFMSQIGSFIPCEEARISVVDTILTRFSSTESCAVPQSSFQLDLTQLGGVLRRASKNSLVIIDEFGKGTSPASGIALLTVALKQLATSGARCVCTTHFLELFSMNLLDRSLESGVAALQMQVQIPENKPNKLPVPLFTLEKGVADSSAGIACAALARVKQSVVDRANEIVHAVRNKEKVKPLVEILRSDLDLSDAAKSALGKFIEEDWIMAPESAIDELLAEISLM